MSSIRGVMLLPISARSYRSHTAHHAFINKVNAPETAAEISDTFWHELTHAILHDMEHPLCRNERFVSGFSERLNRAVNSARLQT